MGIVEPLKMFVRLDEEVVKETLDYLEHKYNDIIKKLTTELEKEKKKKRKIEKEKKQKLNLFLMKNLTLTIMEI